MERKLEISFFSCDPTVMNHSRSGDYAFHGSPQKRSFSSPTFISSQLSLLITLILLSVHANMIWVNRFQALKIKLSGLIVELGNRNYR